MRVIPLDEGTPVITFGTNGVAQVGPAIITKRVLGNTWDGTAAGLSRLANPKDVTGLVVFDTWVRNRDRFRPGHETVRNERNVFLGYEDVPADSYELFAIDHTHCFSEGSLDRRLARIDNVQDTMVYGLFPEFKGYVSREFVELFLNRLREVRVGEMKAFIQEMPQEWDVSDEARRALEDFLVDRAAYLTDRLLGILGDACGWAKV
jgi:hypothetical protein